MNIIFIFIVALSLSMDAFSLSLAYGTISLSKGDINLLSTVVGIYHFFMPILGMLFGGFVTKYIHVSTDIIILIIFSLIGIEMIIDSLSSKKETNKMKLSQIFAFGFAVSIDSFSVGIGINSISDNFILCSFIFSLTSFAFTYIGLILGNKLNQMIGNFATLLGGFTLIILGLGYVL